MNLNINATLDIDLDQASAVRSKAGGSFASDAVWASADGVTRSQAMRLPAPDSSPSAAVFERRGRRTAVMEQNLLDLMNHIDATYRTETPADASVVP